jgi:hypothetical protein
VTALKATCAKIDDYYEKTTATPAYIIAMSMSFTFLGHLINNPTSPQSSAKDGSLQEALASPFAIQGQEM